MSIVYFVLLLGGLIFFHELGHFLVARWMGVRVITFSIGFGPALFTLRGRKKPLKDAQGNVVGEIPPTEYVIAALPLGGYVKMLGHDPSEDIPDRERAVSFQHKPIWRRLLIVSAGPVFNLILPYFLFFFLALGVTEAKSTIVGSVNPNSPAAAAGLLPGDRITAVDGDPVDYFWQLTDRVEGRAGETIRIDWDRHGTPMSASITPERQRDVIVKELGVEREVGRIGIAASYARSVVAPAAGSTAAAAGVQPGDRVVAVDGAPIERMDELEAALAAARGPATLKVVRFERQNQGNLRLSLGRIEEVVVPADPADPQRGLRSAEMVIEKVIPGAPADTVGLRPGDRIVSVDGVRYGLWASLTQWLAQSVGQEHDLVYERDGSERQVKLKLIEVPYPIELRKENKIAVFGASSLGETAELPPVENEALLSFAGHYAIEETHFKIWVIGESIAGLFRGRVPLDDLGGPVLIGQLAARTDERGWSYFFELMALFSINLGLINLLPIPLFDGGHLVFLAIEAVRRRPVSLRTRQITAYIGFAFIIMLMVLVFKNDIERAFFT